MNESLRYVILSRDGHMCILCGDTKDLAVDHIVPRSDGGTDTQDNLQVLCKVCNSKKHALNTSMTFVLRHM